MIAIVENVKGQTGEPYREVCGALVLPYSSLMRWRAHQQSGAELVRRPGPAKTGPLRLSTLYGRIRRELRFGARRVGGSGALYAGLRKRISRRDFYALVRSAAAEVADEAAALERRVEWLVPGAVWALDDAERAWLERYQAYVTLCHDYASRYAVGVQGDDAKPTGLATTLMTEGLFRKMQMCPLFLKHDRGANFMSQEMQDLLSAHWVIPLISPRHYAPYNGAVEREHQEIIRRVDSLLYGTPADGRTFRLACEVSRQEVNHLCRDSLGGLIACQVFEEARPFLQAFGRRQRKEAYEQIEALAFDIVGQLGQHTDNALETAFRYAAETWMQLNHMIRVTQNGRVLPPFYQFQSH
jgi:hypothetical protein